MAANPMVLNALRDSQTIIYSIGSLYTSLIPSLILKGVGEAASSPTIRYKMLILNSTNDRETGPSNDPYTAVDFIAAISKACAESRGFIGEVDKRDYRSYVTHLIHLTGPGTPHVDKEALRDIGIETIKVYGRRVEGENFVRYDEKALVQALEVTLGRRDPRAERVRRKTLEG